MKEKNINSPCLFRLLSARGREPVLPLDPIFQGRDDQSRLVGLGATVAEEPFIFFFEKRGFREKERAGEAAEEVRLRL